MKSPPQELYSILFCYYPELAAKDDVIMHKLVVAEHLLHHKNEWKGLYEMPEGIRPLVNSIYDSLFKSGRR